MSGFGRTGLYKPKVTHPKLPDRPDLSNPKPDIEIVELTDNGLPERPYLSATVRIKKMKPLARVKRKGWYRPAQWPTLWLEISKYISDIPQFTSSKQHRTKKQRQALQVCLHEMMHVALWDDLSITHSEDPESILHFYVEGDTLEPNEWDMNNMMLASERIGFIELNISKVKNTTIHFIIIEAIQMWNEWIGRTFFKDVED